MGGKEGMSAGRSQPPGWCRGAALALPLTVWTRTALSSAERVLCVPALLCHSQCPSTTVVFLRKDPGLHFLYSGGFCPTLLCAM